MTALLRWLSTPAVRRTLALLGAALVVLLACNPELAPLLGLMDVLGLDVLALLLGAQLLATLPWLRLHAGRGLRVAGRLAGGALAGAAGGYLRQLAPFCRDRLGFELWVRRAG
ncbi:hypothetical protein IAE57_13410 [Stenotrophomonas sp. S48]|uniref:hypothetical protein n=1 Tax=unclassified Stenotrophomonas TaxID=196198 RepID=UPI001900466D|nr:MULTISPECIES: hypothetical protein [unclassified Stenotrophomonas]MBK0027164.1 hypothetical protein [Stenotrophomonas sp. S48]MBK0049226.1 hypothetical protein [Stenotrophomonas sp. S49]